jgi:hypothetical protein
VAGQVDERHTVQFQSAEAQFLLVSTAPKTFLLQVLRVHSPGQVVRSQRWLGLSEEALFKAAGPPYRSEGPRHFYACNETDEFAVEVTRSVVTGVVWLPYVD